jgi:cysteine synthase A
MNEDKMDILSRLGKTPLVRVISTDLDQVNLYAKLESYNPTGSMKDRSASYIIQKLLNSGEINKDTVLIESSSGNFGIALSAYCKKFGLQFYCVVDPNISATNEYLIANLSTKMIKVDKVDKNGGYLLSRIEKVKELHEEIQNSYWVNQYGNPYNAEAYRETLGKEICNDMDTIDYIFLGVSSGGTITGVSQKVKEIFPRAKVIAVDTVGSVIFGGVPQKRYIPGIGSSMVPDILQHAKIDEVVMVDETIAVEMCHELLQQQCLFVGGSSGSVYAGIKKYFEGKVFNKKPNVVAVFADRGDRYMDTIYNEEWSARFLKKNPVEFSPKV